MTQIRVYLPTWVRWFVLAIFIPIWGFLTWGAFAGFEGEKLPLFAWVMVTFVFLIIGVMLFLTSSRRLPFRILEIDDEDVKKLLGK